MIQSTVACPDGVTYAYSTTQCPAPASNPSVLPIIIGSAAGGLVFLGVVWWFKCRTSSQVTTFDDGGQSYVTKDVTVEMQG